MRSTRLLFRTGVGAAAMAALAIPTVAVAADPPIIGQQFYADSGEACPLGYTQGVLAWETLPAMPTPIPAVYVSGVVVDGNTCVNTNDPRYTVANFTAYNGKAVVDAEAQKVDNGKLQFELTLTGNSVSTVPPPPIDRVTVQVCRAPVVGDSADSFTYCGQEQTYYPNHTTENS